MASPNEFRSPRSAAAAGHWPLRSGLLDGALLVAVWMALWTFFALGVLEPAARFEGSRPAAVRPA